MIGASSHSARPRGPAGCAQWVDPSIVPPRARLSEPRTCVHRGPKTFLQQPWQFHRGPSGREGGSDSSGRDDSNSSPEEASSHLKKENSAARDTLRSHNSFLPNKTLDEDEEEEDSEGDNLHRYHEDSSFVLHGNSNWPLSNGAISHGDMGGEWGNEGTMLGAERDHEWISNQLHQQDSLQTQCQCFHRMSVTLPVTVSDGVLVNFCTIYNRSNNPATPHDLSSPAAHPYQSSEGSVFLNLQPVPQTPAEGLQHDNMADKSPPPKEEADTTPSASCWSPQGLDSNCNLYSTPWSRPPRVSSSLEVSDLAACLQSQPHCPWRPTRSTTSLCHVTSPPSLPVLPGPASPAVLRVQSRSRPFPPSEHFSVDHKKEAQHKEVMKEEEDHQKEKRLSSAHADCSEFQTHDDQVATTSSERSLYGKKQSYSFQNPLYQSPYSLCPIQCSPHGSQCQGTSTASTQPSVILHQEHCETDATEKGACSLENAVVRYSKAQRPTSLPIQPIFLVPAGKPQMQHLGCLLEQYINQKSSKSSQPGHKFKGKSSQGCSNLQASPMGNHCPIFLEAPSSSDTCSTCTPSPECFSRAWSQSRRGQGCPTPLKSHLVKSPAYQDLINLTPEQGQTKTEPRTVQPEQELPRCRAAPAADFGFFDNSFTAAFSSVAPLSYLSSLFSMAASGLQIQLSAGLSGKQSQNQHSETLILSDRPPTEFCLSPDTSYESMSISHLQRRGLLRSVSRAVDLIMAHFGSSRDPEEKMRLGNSSCSPKIGGLVLEHLCPAIQNILEDGLRDHKLDFIVGQRRNHSWGVVEVSTRIGPSTKVLHSLVSKIRPFPQLSSQCMRLRAFIMGLLNLRALEFWLSHLQSQTDLVTTYYHSWGFLSMSLGQCQPLFQELLLLLQPLTVMPFDLNLLLEPRMLRNRQLYSEEHGVFSSSAMLSPPSDQLATTCKPTKRSTAATVSKTTFHSRQAFIAKTLLGLRIASSRTVKGIGLTGVH
ncbi:hypothetical protein KUCAC02_009261 [Chaenocephalus aceratus]|uniref:Uncharacterized protein n=1 Tax=Chaenocephalus aceratus TaxID=36190 RepID=A0ACB9WTY4_CHAAC|nr:hypothetical protein KUCAC02_009261 [Chaenocephalus aceratus]